MEAQVGHPPPGVVGFARSTKSGRSPITFGLVELARRWGCARNVALSGTLRAHPRPDPPPNRTAGSTVALRRSAHRRQPVLIAAVNGAAPRMSNGSPSGPAGGRREAVP